MAIQVAYMWRHRQPPGRDVAAPGGVCDSITSKFRCVDFARQPREALLCTKSVAGGAVWRLMHDRPGYRPATARLPARHRPTTDPAPDPATGRVSPRTP